MQRGRAKTREGVVVSDKMDKTVVVVVERLVQHPKYKKYLKRARQVSRRTTRRTAAASATAS